MKTIRALLLLSILILPLPGAQDVKTMNGIAIANVKTAKNLAIASVKTVGGVDNTAGGGGTNWTNDATMVAYYRFEASPGISQDSEQTNHVDDNATAEQPVADTGDKIEGSQSAEFEIDGVDDAQVLTVSNATADFPLNGTGDGEITYAGWIKQESNGATQYFCSSIGGANFFRVAATTGVVSIRFDGSAQVTHTSTATISTGTWYFIAAVYSDANNEIRCYIRAQGAGAFTIETTTANIGTLDSAAASSFILGALSDSASTSSFDGRMDAWAVFNGKAFTQAELEGVFDNGWDGDGW